jgi:hypothetical protein
MLLFNYLIFIQKNRTKITSVLNIILFPFFPRTQLRTCAHFSERSLHFNLNLYTTWQLKFHECVNGL